MVIRKSVTFLACVVTAICCFSCKQDARLFTQLTEKETGISFVNLIAVNDSFSALNFDYIYNGGGVAAADFNNDGLPDLYFTGNMVSGRMYLNQGDFKFTDVTTQAGVGTEVWCTGVAAIDINQDGLMDLYVSVGGKAEPEKMGNLLFINQGNDANGVPVFQEMSKPYGLHDQGYSTQAVFFDYDKDGDLDMYLLTNQLVNYNRNVIRPIREDGQLESTDRLYRNDGIGPDGHPVFTNVSKEAGIIIEGFGLGVMVCDLNLDGWPDIYCANDFLSSDLVWINNQDGTFTNKAHEYLRHATYNGMGVDIADFNNDGLPDIVVLDMLPESSYRQKMMLMNANYDKFQASLQNGYLPQFMRNTLQLHRGFNPATGAPTFSEIAPLAGVHNTDWSWAPLLADLDNDGLRDLFISNGYRKDVTNLDFITYSRESVMFGSEKAQVAQLVQELKKLPDVKIPNYVYKNQGGVMFSDESAAWGMNIPTFTNGAIFADLDQDGDLDIILHNMDEPAYIMKNNTQEWQTKHISPNHYLRVVPEGPKGNLQGHEVRVVVRLTNGQTQHEYFTPYRGYKSSVEPVMHFGLGKDAAIEQIEVFWPDGRYQSLSNVAVDQVLKVRHAEATAEKWFAKPALAGKPMLTPSKALVHQHEPFDFVDFKITPTLPHQLSKGGPALAVCDLNGDGLDDVYIGADFGKPGVLAMQQPDGSFLYENLPGSEPFADQAALFFDANNDGLPDLYVVSGGTRFQKESDRYQDRLYLNQAGKLVPAPENLPAMPFSGSCVKAADFDKDGDLDLLVGGKLQPGMYPKPGKTVLLQNNGKGIFTDVTQVLAPGLQEAGMVKDALFSDIDNDGQLEILLVGEWMPLTIFKMHEGKYHDYDHRFGKFLYKDPAKIDLADPFTGWYNSIVAADFDQDGDIDYVVGNLGLNNRFKASHETPVTIYAHDFDQSGSFDPMITYFIHGKEYMAHPRDMVIDQINGMKGRFQRYEEFAKASMSSYFRKDEMEGAYIRKVTNFASMYFENQGNGVLLPRPLPIEAQFAPVHGMLARDFDGDGLQDLLLVGNSYVSEVLTGWYDGSKGLLLKGAGNGEFTPMALAESGFVAEKDARALVMYRGPQRRPFFLVANHQGPVQGFQYAEPVTCRFVEALPQDHVANITLADGRSCRQELFYGNSYYSQSVRVWEVPLQAVELKITSFSGEVRRVDVGALSAR